MAKKCILAFILIIILAIFLGIFLTEDNGSVDVYIDGENVTASSSCQFFRIWKHYKKS